MKTLNRYWRPPVVTSLEVLHLNPQVSSLTNPSAWLDRSHHLLNTGKEEASYYMNNYRFAKYLAQIIKTSCNSSFSVYSSNSFVSQQQSISPSNSIMCSLDIQSFFTIPFQLTVDLVVKHIFQHNTHFYNLEKNTLSIFLSLATSDAYFIFNNAMCQQKDGIAMGSPLGPILADFFIFHSESSYLSSSSVVSPPFSKDILTTFYVYFHLENMLLISFPTLTLNTNIQCTLSMNINMHYLF